ncbi:MAG: hypothetical protein ACI4LA_03730 [Emergencia sp.]
MRKSGRTASFALAVHIVSGILGLACLAVMGMRTADSAVNLLNSPFLPVLCVLLAVMALSLTVMLIALTRGR